MVEISSNDSPLDVLNSQRLLGRDLKRSGYCSEFLPMNRSAKPGHRVDCYFFDLTIDKDVIATRFQSVFAGKVGVADGNNSIHWQLAHLAGQVTETLFSDFWDDHTRQHQLVSYFVHRIVRTIGAEKHLQDVFFASYLPLAEGNQALSNIADRVSAVLMDFCPSQVERYRLFRCNFLHYVLNSLGKSSQQEYYEVSQWLDNDGIS
jgi:hypothetical protein